MHRTEIHARFSDADAYGHINHAAYVDHLQEARLAAITDSGVDAHGLAAEGLYTVTVELRIGYHHATVPGRTLTVTSWLSEMRVTSAWWHQEIHCEDGRLVTAEARCALIDEQGRATRIPRKVAASLQQLLPTAAA